MQVNNILQGMLFCCVLLFASYMDIKKRIIPDVLSVLIVTVGLIDFHPANLFGVFAALPFFLAALWKENSIGGGDIKLTAAVGTVLGFWSDIWGAILGLSTFLLFYFLFHIIKKMRKEQVGENVSFPLAPFLSIGFLLMYFI